MKTKYFPVALLLIGCLVGLIPSISDAGDKFYYGTWPYEFFSSLDVFPIWKDTLCFNYVFLGIGNDAQACSLAKYGIRVTQMGGPPEGGHTAKSYYSVWEAEGGPPGTIYHLSYSQGRLVSDNDASGQKAWMVSSNLGDMADTIQDGPATLWGYYQEAKYVWSGVAVEYDAEFRLKLISDALDTTKICKLIVQDAQDGWIFAESTLHKSDFATNEYDTFALSYTLSKGASLENRPLEFRIFWYGVDDLFIDYVKIFNQDGLKLINGDYDQEIIDYIHQSFADTVIHGTGEYVIYRWYMRDEPMVDNYRPCVYVDSLLRQETPGRVGMQAFAGLGQPQCATHEYLLRVNPQELHVDPYIVGWLGNDYSGSIFQGAITNFASFLNMLRTEANNFGKDLWVTIQAFTGGDTTSSPDLCQHPLFYGGSWYCTWSREPTPLELRLQTYLAMCYGANAIMNWKYFYEQGSGYIVTGLYDQLAEPDSTTSKWREIRDFIGPRMKALGPRYAPLEWQGACLDDVVNSFVLRNGQPSYLDSIRSPGHEPHWVQVGFFENQAADTSYFMLVNRECLATEGANYDVFVTKTGGPYQIRDMYTDSIVDQVSGTGDHFTIYLGPGEGKLLRLESTGHGPTLFKPPVNYAGVPYYVSDIFAADLDNDGDSDLAVANYYYKFSYSHAVTIFKNRGDGAFDTTRSCFPGHWPLSLSAADYNKDGDKDLAVANYGDNTVSIFENNGSGAFSYLDDNSVLTPQAVISADFNKDGYYDLAVSLGFYDSVAVLMNDRYGWFNPAVYYYTGGTDAHDLFAADFNGDTIPDLAIPNYSGDNLSILINNGNGTFQSPLNYSTGNYPIAICGADLDKDGDCDLVVANQGGSPPPPYPSITIFKNNGNGTFYSANSYVVSGINHIVTADFDLDGDFDLAFTSGTSESLFVWLNTGNGTFQPAEAHFVGGSWDPLVACDLNGDGTPDLAVGRGYDYDDVAILINLSTNLPPNPFSLISPPDKDTILPTNSYAYVDFDWQETFDPEGDSVWYALYISRSPSFRPESTTIHANLLQTHYSDSLQAGTYFWKVKASDKWGAPRWSNQTWSLWTYICGDVTGNGVVDAGDLVYLLNYLFLQGPPPACPSDRTGDVTGNGITDAGDLVYLLNYLFLHGPEPACIY